MNTGRFILTQVLDLVHRQTLERLVNKYKAQSKVRQIVAFRARKAAPGCDLVWVR